MKDDYTINNSPFLTEVEGMYFLNLGVKGLTLSLTRVMNFKFPLQPHQKYSTTQYEERGFSQLAQMKDDYTTDPRYLSQTFFSLKDWENVLFELGSESLNEEQVATTVLQYLNQFFFLTTELNLDYTEFRQSSIRVCPRNSSVWVNLCTMWFAFQIIRQRQRVREKCDQQILWPGLSAQRYNGLGTWWLQPVLRCKLPRSGSHWTRLLWQCAHFQACSRWGCRWPDRWACCLCFSARCRYGWPLPVVMKFLTNASCKSFVTKGKRSLLCGQMTELLLKTLEVKISTDKLFQHSRTLLLELQYPSED